MFTNQENKQHAIIANFARSFDKSHNDRNRTHLISSICLVKGQNLVQLEQIILNGESGELGDISYVFILLPKELMVDNDFSKKSIGDLEIIITTIENLISHLGLTGKNDELLSNVLGGLGSSSLNSNNVIQKSLFIFSNQMWSNILLKFKINNIDISGCSSAKRHILQTVDYQLSLFLSRAFKSHYTIQELLYNSYKDPILSSTIPIEYYKNYNLYYPGLKSDLINSRAADINEIPFKINNILKIDNGLLNSAYFRYYEGIFIDNFKLTVQMLILDIEDRLTQDIEDFKKEKGDLESKISTLNYEINKIENINNISTKHMSNKEKKEMKKENKEMNQILQSSDYVSSREHQIKFIYNKIENIDGKLINKNKELDDFIKNKQDYTILELNNYHSRIGLDNLKTIARAASSLTKYSKKKLKSISYNNIRKYSSFSVNKVLALNLL